MNYKETKMFSEINQQPSVISRLEELNKNVYLSLKKEVAARQIQQFTIVARGSSDNACTYFKYMSEVYCGIPCASAAPSVVTMYNGSLAIKNNLVVGVSQSGKAADVMEIMKKARENGSLLVSVTNDTESPMAKLADYHIFLGAEKEESVAATKTFTAQMFSLGLLVAYISGKTEVFDALNRLPAKISEVIKNSDALLPAVKAIKPFDNCFVLARGLNYSAALESALKMQETTYIKAKAFASSDFHHGPFAMVDNDTLAILLMPQGESFSDQVEMLDKCNAQNAKTIVFTDSDKTGSLATVKVPAGSDIETPILNVVTMQLIVNMLSVEKGLNPDAPRGLNKVTITK